MSNSATIILLLLLILTLFALRSSNPLNSKISQFTFPILQFTFQIHNSCLKFSYYHLVVDCNSNSFCSAFEQNTQFGNIFQFTFQIPIFPFGAEHRTDNSFLIKQKSSSWWVSTSYSSYDSVLHPQLENRRLDQETWDPIFNCGTFPLYFVMISILLLTWDRENHFCKNHWQWHTQINQSLFPRSHNFSKSIATSSKVPQHILSCKSF